MKAQDQANIRELPIPDLKLQLKDCEEKLFNLRFKNSISRLKNGLEIRELRKHKARLITWLRQKEIAETKKAVPV
ncbi:MAG: 50S ribosomal protein L29 [Elusimicrobia bacterium]|nr:50S ribosomal protein L29 [Elusimicrobiota bacterium]